MKNIFSYIPRFFREWRDGVNPPVFFAAAVLTWGIILFGGIWTKTAGRVFGVTLDFISAGFGWYYVVITTGFLVFVLWLMLGRFGSIRLGEPDSEPEFGYASWFSMLFAAGMGMGLVFWGVAEPMSHYLAPPRAAPESAAAVREAMRMSFFHWGLHPWAIYIVFGLGIAYYHFRHKQPLAPRSLLYPLIGGKADGWIGDVTDAFCTVGTLLGVSTSLGLGAMQINAGLSNLGGFEYGINVQLVIVAVITVIATASTVSGIGMGIRILSVTNMIFMVVLFAFVAAVGPTLYQIMTFFSSTGDYLQNIVSTSLWMDLRPGSDWQHSWTFFYWGWWISWSPFVGIFIARISRGRTIREFVFFVLLIPTLVNFMWFSVFGGTALHIELFGGNGFATEITDNVAMSLTLLLDHLPFGYVMNWFALALVIIFFITSSDSGSYVDDMVTSGGNPDPPVANRVFWGLSEGAAAAALLLAGGLNALQAASISAGLPQSILIIAGVAGLIVSLRREGADEQVIDTSDSPGNERLHKAGE